MAGFAASAAGASPEIGESPVVSGVFRGSHIATRFDVSPPLRSMRPQPVKPEAERDEFEDRKTGLEGPLGAQRPDAAVQSDVGTGGLPAPLTSFDGPSNAANVSPPDPVGDVGPDHYVAMSNLYFAIYSKAGVLQFGPVPNNTLWAGFGGPCQAENAGDPIVLYDQIADRWILTQFTSAGPSYFNCVAVSTTGDPAGTYYRYAFPTGTNFPDYPKYGLWSDALYISTREFVGAAGPFAGVGAYAVNRTQLLAGNPAAQLISFLAPPGGSAYNVGDGLLPADLDGTTLPPAGSPEYFVGSMDQGGPYGAPQDALSLWRFHADFGTPGNSTFVLAGPIPVAEFDSVFGTCSATRQCIPQPGTSNRVDILSYRQRLLHRLAYRNFGTHESLVTNQSVEATATIAGIRWYEIRDPNGTPAIHQQGTYAPGASDGIHRWMGSIAMDASGNMALGFSASDASLVFPGVRYTGRLAADPPGTMPQGEGTIVGGGGSQTGSSRWGDYTSMNVDPVDDCTFWYVNEYLPATSAVGWRLRIGSFRFPSCVSGPSGTLQGQVTVCGSGTPLAGATVAAGVYSTTTDASGHYAFALPPGDYAAAITAPGYTSGAGPVTITDGGTTVLDACLTGVPVIVPAGATLQSEGCIAGNGRVDPGERVSVNFCVRNVGGASTANLVGELEETGGVGDAPDPIAFGAVLAGGPDVCVLVTFTAADTLVCGDDVTASVELEEGPAELGTADFTLPSGTEVVSLTESFDAVAIPALPDGWTSTTIAGPLPPWVTSAASSDTAPNAAFSPDPSGAGNGYANQLVSPPIAVTSPSATLSFRSSFNLESTYDGGVLEVSVGGAPFQDILAAGGSFLSGGYTGTIDTGFQNPLAGRSAWTGTSNGYITTIAALPASAAGQSVVWRWRLGVDITVASTGWYVDTVVVHDGFTCCTPIPEGIDVDQNGPLTGGEAPLNQVWEPGEGVIIEPAYFNGDSKPLSLSGTLVDLTGPPGASYGIPDSTADYGSIAPNGDASCLATGNCYVVTVDDPAVRPAAHWDATASELLSTSLLKLWTLHIGKSFADVPDSLNFYPYIETVFHEGVTTGCGGTNYCPGNPALRKQMAVFLLKSRYGAGYVPPPALGIFADVPGDDPFAPWIEDLYNRGITGGCASAPLRYCPDAAVLRQQMAVFLLKTLEGSDYEPPECETVFTDVPCPSTFADWIEELADREITGGCGVNIFCPTSPNTRGQMAVFLTKTFRLVLYGP